MSARINDAFDDAVIDIVAKDPLTERERIPNLPNYPTPDPELTEGTYPILPLNPDLIKAGQYGMRAPGILQPSRTAG